MTTKVDRRPRKYPRTPIASAMTGEIVKIVGWVRATAPPFTSPLTGASCVWYTTRVDPYRPWYDEGQPVVEMRSQDIYVDDDSGSALVRMERADVRLGSMRDDWQVEQTGEPESWITWTWSRYEPPDSLDDRKVAKTEILQNFLQRHGVPLFNRPPSPSEAVWGIQQLPPSKRKARFREDVLHEGTKVAVLGRAFQEPDPTAPLIDMRQPATRLILGAAPYGIVVSNEPDDLS